MAKSENAQRHMTSNQESLFSRDGIAQGRSINSLD